MSREFLLTSLIVVLIPGTGTVYTISTGLFQRWCASIAAAFGCTAGILPHVAASILGLSIMVQMSAMVFAALTWTGALYLLFLAWAMWRDQDALAFDTAARHHNASLSMLKAIVLNLLNPKLTLFFFAFLPLFITPHTPSPTAALFELSAAFMAITLVVFVGYGVLASGVRKYVGTSPRAIMCLQRSCAFAFAVLAVHFALTG